MNDVSGNPNESVSSNDDIIVDVSGNDSVDISGNDIVNNEDISISSTEINNETVNNILIEVKQTNFFLAALLFVTLWVYISAIIKSAVRNVVKK